MRKKVIGLLTLLMASCSSILPKPPAVHDFGYSTTTEQHENTTNQQVTLITVVAPRWLADNRISYRLNYATPTQVRFYSLDRWIAPPSELFQQLLMMSDIQSPSPLNLQLETFEQQFESKDQARVVMSFTVLTVPANTKEKSKKQTFQLQQACPTPDAKGAVAGFTLLTKQAVGKIKVWLLEEN